MNLTFDLQNLKALFHRSVQPESNTVNIYSDSDNIFRICKAHQKNGRKIQLQLSSGSIKQVFVQKVLGKHYIIAEERRFPWFRFSMIAFDEIRSVSTI